MKRSIPLSLALTLLFTGLSMSVVFADELEAEEAVISETAIDDTDVSASEDSIEIIPSEVSDDDLTGDTEDLIDADNMSMQPIEGNGTAGETVTDGVYKGVVNADGTVTVTGLVNPSEHFDVLSIPGEIEGKKVTIIDDGAFYDYDLSEELFIPDTVTKIGDLAFSDASFNRGIVLGESIKTIGDKAFYNCYLLGDGKDNTLVIPDSVEIIGESAFENMSKEYNHKLILGKRVKKIEDRAFFNCEFEGDLIIPDSVITIGDEAFTFDSDKYWNASNFTGKLILGKRVKSIGKGAFKGCGFTGGLIVPNSVVTIGDNAFEECYDFSGSLKIGGNVKTIGARAFRATGFNGTLKLGKKVKKIGEFAFSECSFKGDLTIPDGVTVIEDFTFGKVPNNYTHNFTGKLNFGKNVKSIERGAFLGCWFKGDLVLPQKIKEVGNGAFSQCEYIRNIIIPRIKHIADSAFGNCFRVRRIINNSSQTIKAGDFMCSYDESFSDSHGGKIRYNDVIKTGIYIKSYIGVKDVRIENSKEKMIKGSKITLKYEISPSNAFNQKVTWKSSNPKIASVSKKGVVKGRKPGTATITVTTVDGKKTAKCRVTVKNLIKVKSVKLDKVAFINTGDTATLEPRIKPSNATNKRVTWESSDPSIVSVDKNGVIKGLKSGIAYITVTTEDGNKTAKCKVTVRQ